MMIIFLCASVVVLCVNLTQAVQFTRLDLARNRSLAINVPIDQSTKVEAEVSSLCHKLYLDEGASAAEVSRCVSMASPTIRDYKLQAFSNMLVTSLSKGVTDDATQMALQYAYEQTVSGRHLKRVCAIGFPTIDSALSILHNSDASEFWLFSKHRYSNSSTLYENFTRKSAKSLNKTVEFVFGDIMVMLRGLQVHSRYRLCDVLHFEDSDIFGPALTHASATLGTNEEYNIHHWIQDVASVLIDSAGDKSSSTAPPEPLQIVWVRNIDMSELSPKLPPLITLQDKSYLPFNSTAPLMHQSPRVLNAQATAPSATTNSPGRIRWKLSSVWLNESRITAIGNFDGFTGRTYFSPQTSELHLREVLLGEVAPRTESSLFDTSKTSQADAEFIDPAAALKTTVNKAVGNKEDNTKVVIAITFTIRVFAETAAGLRRALHSLGYAHVFIVPDLTLSAVDYLQSHLDSLNPHQRGLEKDGEGRSEPARLLLQIALGPHDVAMLLPHYLVFQMEQTWSTIAFTGHYKTRYALVLSNALCILAYSYVHAELLRALGYPCVQVVPLYSYTPETETLLLNNTADADRDDKIFDFLFYGGCSERRRELLAQIRILFPDCSKQASIAGEELPLCYRYSLHCVGWENGVFDAVRLTHVVHTHLVLNLHTDEDSVLEAHRLNYLLSLGKCVVSERSGDTQLDARYASAVHFVQEGDLTAVQEVMAGLLGNATALQECETNARTLYAQLSGDTQDLQIALSEAFKLSSTMI